MIDIPFEKFPFNGDVWLESKLLDIKEKYNITSVVETCTCNGTNTEWFSKKFDAVSTCEMYPDNFNKAQKRLKRKKNISQYYGETRDCLPDMISFSTGNIMVFLDDKYFSNSLLDELQVIEDKKVKPVIVIHDFRNPFDLTMGYDTYPEQKISHDFGYVQPSLNKIYKNKFNFEFNKKSSGARRGCIFIYPV